MDVPDSVAWARSVATIARGTSSVRERRVRLFVLPSLPAVEAVRRELRGTGVEVGAQDLHWEDRGAYTGAVSGTDLYATGSRFVEVGHAERRHIFGEGDDVVRRKLAAAVRNGLTPVLCIGESESTGPDVAAQYCVAQLAAALAGVDPSIAPTAVVVAYEPEWAIGQPTAAPADHVRIVVQALKARLREEAWISHASVIYGGSAQRGTLSELGDTIDGLFLGRFAHDPTELARIIDEAAEVA
ncbi:MAG: triose-phosphate isomerase [Actinobacteria bacterium]|nr:triose-phosphate isomerase [Actinomycetota bacterium]